MVTDSPRTVHQRIIDAYRIIAKTDFSKTGRVKAGNNGYNFIPISDILAAVRKAHSEAGLFVTLGPLEYDEANGEYRGGVSKESTDYNTGKKYSTKWEVAIGRCEVTIHGADGDSVSMIVPFQVQDNSDKASNKIITNIQRSVYRMLYSIDEGDGYDPVSGDPEATAPPKVDPFFKSASKIYHDQPVPKKEGAQ